MESSVAEPVICRRCDLDERYRECTCRSHSRRPNVEVRTTMEYKIIARTFDTQMAAHIWAIQHLCVATMNGSVIENRNPGGDVVDYSVLELVAA